MINYRTFTAVAAAVLAVTSITACGNSETRDNKTAESASVTSDVDAAYDGPDKQYFTEISVPKEVEGQSFKVGFLQIAGAQPVLVAMQEAAQEEVERLGGTMIVKDAGLDLQKQQSQLDELISQHVDIIIGFPVVGSALDAGVTKAAQAGIPFVALDTPPDVEKPALTDAVTNVNQALDYAVWSTMRVLAKKHPGGSFAVMGFAAPVDSLQYMSERTIYWGQELGMKLLGRVDSQADSPSAYGQAADALLTKYGDEVDAIVTFNDQSALAGQSAAVASGKGAIDFADPNSGQSIAQSALKAGKLAVVFRTPWEAMGRIAADIAYTKLTDPSATFDTVVNVPGTAVTKDNVDDVPWIK